MNPPDLRRLQQGDKEAWDVAFDCLWPAAFAAARSVLHPVLTNEVEDVAIEALEALAEKVRSLKSVEDLKPLAAAIAHNRAVSLLRERFAQKRDAGKTESLDVPAGESGHIDEPVSEASPLDKLEQKELAELLRRSLAELKPPQGEILSDFFLQDLCYEEIVQKRGVPIGSVGVYLKRGLETLLKIWCREENK